MNEMYTMGLSIHSIGTALLLGVMLLNLLVLKKSTSLVKYKRVKSIFLLPLTITVLGTALFTGVIMMAAKHLDFTIPNIAMIIISIVIIFLEAKRNKALKYINASKSRALEAYQGFATKLLVLEIVLTLSVALWMWLI
jgi:hypothetical protein